MFYRALFNELKHHLKPNKVCLLLGARRVGKTILLEKLKDDFNGKVLFLNGEDEDSFKLIETKSSSNYKRLLNGVNLLIIDEAQAVPDIGKKLKLMVDTVKDIKIIATGEESGKLDKVLDDMYKYYNGEVEQITANLTKLLEPFILVLVGGMVAFLAVAIYLPIYQIGNAPGLQ